MATLRIVIAEDNYLVREGTRRLLEDSGEVDVAAAVGPQVGLDEAQVARVLREVGVSFMNFQVVAQREAETRAELAAKPDVVAAVPYFDRDIVDVAGLVRLGGAIWR